MAQQQMEFVSEFKPELAEYDDSGSEDEEDAEFVPVNASFDKFNESFEKDQEFWKHAYESLDEEEYEKLANDNIAKKQNDFEKFNESFEQESDFWKNASVSLDQSDFEKLVEEQCLEEPFCDDVQMDIDFEPYLNLFKKGDKFWNLATKNLKDEEYEKLVQIYIASEKITWNNLTSDVFLAKPRTGEAEGGQASTKSAAAITDLICQTCDVKFEKQEDLNVHLPSHEDVKPFVCDICPKTFKLSNQLRLHKEFNHSQDKPLTCNFCFRHFKQFDALQKHRQIHTAF